MIIKKLLAPLVNNKIINEAEYCYIASAAISEPAFDWLMSKLSPKCHVDIITGLDLPTHPNVLRKALRQYPDRVTMRVHAKNSFHSNAYIFDLPYRKRVAFIGSGNFTWGGIKDNEELFYKIDAEKAVEELKAWFRSYFEYGYDLKEKMIAEYESFYPSLLKKGNEAREEVQYIKDIVTGRFRWESINFKEQYFKLEDYLTFENSKASINNELMRIERLQVQNKLLDLHERLKSYVNKHKLYEHYDSNFIISNVDPVYHSGHKVKSMWLSYGKSKKELDGYKERYSDLIMIRVLLRQREFGLWLVVGKDNGSKIDRAYFRNEMQKEDYRKKFYDLVKKCGEFYWIEAAGEKRMLNSFSDDNNLLEFTNRDQNGFSFIIGRTYSPGDSSISQDAIVNTIKEEFDKLIPLYHWMKDKSFE